MIWLNKNFWLQINQNAVCQPQTSNYVFCSSLSISKLGDHGLDHHSQRFHSSFQNITDDNIIIYIYTKMKILRYQMALAVISAVCLVLSSCDVISPNQITPLEMESLLQTIDSYFFKKPPIFNLQIRKFIRAAFHDCMGGCDGSINASNPSNKGLEPFAKGMSEAYSLATNPANTSNAEIFKKLSRADFWVLSVERALAWSIVNGAQVPEFINEPTFYYGRISQPSGTQADPLEGDYPGGEQNWADMLASVHSGVPTLNQYDIVALLGLHVAGSVHVKNSGYNSPVGQLNIVNNNYYRNLLGYHYPNDTFYQVKASDSFYASKNSTIHSQKIQWDHRPTDYTPGMMMPIDMLVYLKFHVNSTGGTDQGEYCPQGFNQTLYDCSLSSTPQKTYLPVAPTAKQAFAYAKNRPLFLREVIPAYLKMVKYTNPEVTLTPFKPKLGCVNGVPTCLGDIFFSGCGTVTTVC